MLSLIACSDSGTGFQSRPTFARGRQGAHRPLQRNLRAACARSGRCQPLSGLLGPGRHAVFIRGHLRNEAGRSKTFCQTMKASP